MDAQTAISSCQGYVIEASSPEQITEQIRALGWDNDYEQLGAGDFRGRVNVAQLGSIQVAGLGYTNQILCRGLAPPGCITLAIVGHVSGRSRWRGHDVRRDFTIVADARVEIDILMGDVFVLWLLVIPEALIGEEAAGRSVLDRLDIDPDLSRRIVRHIQFGLSLTAAPRMTPLGPEAVAGFETRSIELARQAFLGRNAWSPPPPIASRFEQLARTDLQGSWTVPQMATRLQVSERTLRRASREAFGYSPLQFGKVLRLNALRRDLHTAPPGETHIWKIAEHHGFWHMGQLGRDFRALFGQSPSAVLGAEAASG